MKVLLKITQQDIDPPHVQSEGVKYRDRFAARAVLRDSRGRVALLYASRLGYYKLPGGGVEKDEDMHAALARELLEEVGTEAKVVGEIGRVEEWRNYGDAGLHQVSDAYSAVVSGEIGQSNFTEKEARDGFSVVWTETIQQAVELVSRGLDHQDASVRFMSVRDDAILKELL